MYVMFNIVLFVVMKLKNHHFFYQIVDLNQKVVVQIGGRD